MAHSPGVQKSGGQKGQAAGLMLIRMTVGAYVFFTGVSRLSWLIDATPWTTQLSHWLSVATPMNRWYLDRIVPGAPIFARIIPLADMIGGLALALGVWTRLAAALCLVMVLNVQLAAGTMFKYSFLTDASGLPVIGALLGLMMGGGRLPLSLRK